jgi:hypothetical protein
MNINKRPVYQKGLPRKRRLSRRPNAEEKRHMARVASLPCIVGPCGCNYRGRVVTLHHCGTRRGGRKDHMKVIPLCWEHHLGRLGIDGKRISFAEWQRQFGTEEKLLKRVNALLK